MLLVFKEAVSFVKTLELVLVFVANTNLTLHLLDLPVNLVNPENPANPAIMMPIKGVFVK
jgi:hypothetical protein